MADYLTAADDMIRLLKTAWASGAAAAVGLPSPPELVVETMDRSGHGSPERPPTAPWGRVSVHHGDAPPRSIGGGPGRSQLINREGFIWVECRVPNHDGASGRQVVQLAQVAADAFEKKRVNGIWFPRVVLRELGKEDRHWVRADVLAYFQRTKAVA